jgi:PEP-CTERM motif-containing protein
MKSVIMFVFLATIAALPAPVDAQTKKSDGAYLSLKTDKKPKGVPEPATMLLIGAAAAGLVGVRKLIRRKRG